MSALQEEIVNLKSEIEGYRIDLSVATTKEEKSELRVLITERGKTLNALLTQQQQQQQQQQQGGKFYIHIVHCVCVLVCGVGECLSSCYKLVY